MAFSLAHKQKAAKAFTYFAQERGLNLGDQQSFNQCVQEFIARLDLVVEEPALDQYLSEFEGYVSVKEQDQLVKSLALKLGVDEAAVQAKLDELKP